MSDPIQLSENLTVLWEGDVEGYAPAIELWNRVMVELEGELKGLDWATRVLPTWGLNVQQKLPDWLIVALRAAGAAEVGLYKPRSIPVVATFGGDRLLINVGVGSNERDREDRVPATMALLAHLTLRTPFSGERTAICLEPLVGSAGAEHKPIRFGRALASDVRMTGWWTFGGQVVLRVGLLMGLSAKSARLATLKLVNTGPADELTLDPLAPRMNVITGDNGLGKSFLTDILWWTLTNTWAGFGTWTGFQAMPRDPDNAAISAKIVCGKSEEMLAARWDREKQAWAVDSQPAFMVGLALYARADGSIAIWDSHRNTTNVRLPHGATVRPPDSFFFSPNELFFGLDRKDLRENNYRICNGLIADWSIWQRASEPQFDLLMRVLATLGPDGAGLVPGEVLQPFTEDVRHFPSVRMPYAQDVPIVFAPAGVKRMVGLAYALTWAISEHSRLVNAQGGVPARSVVLLIDEPETHLHPRWQRTILPSLLKALEVGFGEPKVDVQMFVATHSPLVLASLEPHFDPALDALWKLDLVDGEVKLERDVWHKRGDANAWLTSDVFDMSSSRSVEAEKALKRAKALALRGTATPEEIAEVQAELARSLTDTDRAWRAWESFVEHLGTKR